MSNKPLTKITSNTYINCLKRLDSINIDYSINCDENQLIDQMINLKNFKNGKNISSKTTRLYLSAILWHHKDTNIIFTNIHNYISKINKTDKEIYANNSLNDKELEKFIAWEDILSVYQKLILNKHKSQMHFKKCITIALYTMFPPRRLKDYASMIVIKNSICDDNINNFFVIDEFKFIFNNYKTYKTYGKQQFEISNELLHILNEYIDTYKLINKKLLGHTENDLSEKIKNIFIHFCNKSVTVNTLRHVYISHLFNNGELSWTKQQTDIANKMAHSKNMQQDVYKKKISIN